MITLLHNDIAIVAHVPSGPRRSDATATAERLMQHVLGSHVTLGHRSDGAPVACGAEHMHVSVSHTRSLVAVAVSSRPVGIDIEERRERLTAIAHRFLAPEESFADLDSLLRAWTAKEAVYKLAGRDGLDFMPHIVVDNSFGHATLRGTAYALHHCQLDDKNLLCIAYGN